MRTFQLFLSLLILFNLSSSAFAQNKSNPILDLRAPESGEELLIGYKKGIHFVAKFSDATGLDSYKIEIVSDTQSPKKSKKIVSSSWDLSSVKDTLIHHHDLLIPKKVKPGKYYFILSCKNKKGDVEEIKISVSLVKP